MTRPGVFVTESVLPTPIADQPSSSAAGAMLATLPGGPTGPTLVTSWYQFATLFGGLNNAYPGSFAANLFFRAGGRELYVARLVKSDAEAAAVNIKTSDDSNWLTFTAKAAGTYGNSLRVVVTKNAKNLYDLTVLREAGVSSDISDDEVLESFYDLDLATFGGATVTNTINLRSQYINVAWVSGSSAKSIATSISTLVLSGGDDGSSGTLNYSGALTALGLLNRSLVVFAPGVTDTTALAGITTFAAANQSFHVIDTASGVVPGDAVTYAGTLTKSTYAAVYYPHLWVPDPTVPARDAITLVPPSGAVVGTILATDATTGVFKAPAGLETAVGGVIALERSLTAANLDTLNGDVSPVNAIRIVPGVGPAIMGARTLDQSGSTRYVNIRRSLSYISREAQNRLAFAMFRNNDLTLWNQMKTVLDTFLVGFWGAGGLRGATKDTAYYIKIDSENNTPTDIANGTVNVEIGVALQYPAEFIKVKLTQQTLA